MKRFLLFFVAALLFVSCDNKFEDEGNTIQRVSTLPTLTAEFAEDATRTYVEDNSYLRWHEGDLISAFVGNSRNSKYIFDGKTGDNSGEFEPVGSNSSGEVYDLNRNYALYPYDEDALATDDPFICCSLPAVQEYAENSFGKGANTMVAVTKSTDDTFLAFKNACGYLKIKLYGNATVESIELKGNNGENIAGEVGIRTNYGSAPVVKWFAGTDSITLDCGEGVKLSTDAENPTEFWFVVPPTEFSEGLTIVATDIYGATFEKSTNKKVTITRNEIQPMTAVETIFEFTCNEIWYTSSDGEIVEPYIGPDPNVPSETVDVKSSFGVNIISNTYKNGKGVITFDDDVVKIGGCAFYNCDNLSSITIPYGVTEIGYCAFEGCTNLTKVINESTYFSRIQQKPFNNCTNLKTFEGKLASEDGRCLVSEDGVLLTCATAGLTEYTLPNNVKEVYDSAFQFQNDIQKLTIPEGVTTFGWCAFANSESLTEVTIPKSITDPGNHTFYGCMNLSKLHIYNDIIGEYQFSACWSLTDIIIPENVTVIKEGGFGNCQGLKSVTFHNNLKEIGYQAFYRCALTSVTIPESVETIGDAPFWECDKLMEFNGKFASGDKICLIADGRLVDVADGIVNELSDYTIPAEVTHIGDSVFSNSSNLNSITIPEGVVDIGICAFGSCENLKEITIPSTVTDIGVSAFSLCSKMSAIYFRGVTPPNVYEGGIYKGRHIATQGTIIRVPDEYIDNYKNSSLWGGEWYTILGYNEDLYSSTDYSEDGKVTLLNRATKGNGIDIVIMGDAYSDRQIAAGDYSADINKAIEALFGEEPYKSFRDYFNVYMVTVVSPYDGYFIGSTALGGYFGTGTRVGGNDSSVISYAQKAISYERMDDAMLVVIMNREYYAGTCYMYYPGGTSDYGRGLSISYFPLGTNDGMLAQLILHETGGHGFAKLADEYSYSYMGEIPESEIESYKRQRQNWGWWKNVDFTSDTSAVRWSHFINDNRYANEGLGAFEGGLTYWAGVWRPTKNSIMNQNTGGFNAPSREAIYYRIHKLAYGDSWEYDYEKFVEWDKSKGAAASKASSWHAPLQYPHTTPPVVVGHSWRDAK